MTSMIEGEDGLPHTRACAERIGNAFYSDFEETFGRVDELAPVEGVGVPVGEDGTIEAVSETFESGYDAANARFDSVVATEAMYETYTERRNLVNLDDGINMCLEYAIALNWDYFTFRKHMDDAGSAMELFELGMTEAGGDVVQPARGGGAAPQSCVPWPRSAGPVARATRTACRARTASVGPSRR